jgi:hypothetical protein
MNSGSAQMGLQLRPRVICDVSCVSSEHIMDKEDFTDCNWWSDVFSEWVVGLHCLFLYVFPLVYFSEASILELFSARSMENLQEPNRSEFHV